jgi:hypothetical protein
VNWKLEQVHVYRPGRIEAITRPSDILSADKVLPGFKSRLSQVLSQVIPVNFAKEFACVRRRSACSAVSVRERERGQASHQQGRLSLSDFSALLSRARVSCLSNLGAVRPAVVPNSVLERSFGFLPPLYLSNECINNCRYCGFSRDNPILRSL